MDVQKIDKQEINVQTIDYRESITTNRCAQNRNNKSMCRKSTQQIDVQKIDKQETSMTDGLPGRDA